VVSTTRKCGGDAALTVDEVDVKDGDCGAEGIRSATRARYLHTLEEGWAAASGKT
jgi:hypothetical protein